MTRLHRPSPAKAATTAAVPPISPPTTERSAVVRCPNSRRRSAICVAPKEEIGSVRLITASGSAMSGASIQPAIGCASAMISRAERKEKACCDR